MKRDGKVIKTNSRLFAWLPGLIISVLAFLEFSGSLSDLTFARLGGDMHMIMSRALVDISPNLFLEDFLFDKEENYQFYYNLHVAFSEIILRLKIAESPWVYATMKGTLACVFLIGYYLLGVRLLQNGLTAVLFSLTCAVLVPTISGDYWGLYRVPQARTFFSAVFPYIILFALKSNGRLTSWIFAMSFAGISYWLHPASGPPVGLALLLAMMIRARDSLNKLDLIKYSIVSGIFYLIIVMPNLWQYTQSVLEARVGANAIITGEVRALRFLPDYLDAWVGIKNGFFTMFDGPNFFILLLGIASTAFLLITKRDKDAIFIVILLFTILFVAVIVPILENVIARVVGQRPAQLDLVRSVRYIIPIIILLCFLAIKNLRLSATVEISFAMVFLTYWGLAQQFSSNGYDDQTYLLGLNCWRNGQILCPRRDDAEEKELIRFVKHELPRNSKIFSPGLGTMLRAASGQPLAFNWKDIGWLAYSNHIRLGENYDAVKNYLEIRTHGRLLRQKRWLEFGQDVGAEYIVLVPPVHSNSLTEGARVLFKNELGLVIKLRPQ